MVKKRYNLDDALADLKKRQDLYNKSNNTINGLFKDINDNFTCMSITLPEDKKKIVDKEIKAVDAKLEVVTRFRDTVKVIEDFCAALVNFDTPPDERTYSPVMRTDYPGVRTDYPGERTDSPGVRTDYPGERTDSPGEKTESPGVRTESPDRPGRPSVPTPSKYGTLYGGAPSPGPAPSSAFRPPGFVPPTPPASSSTSGSRKVLKLSQTKLLSSISEDSQQQNTKKT